MRTWDLVRSGWIGWAIVVGMPARVEGQVAADLSGIQVLTNREVRVQGTRSAVGPLRIEVSQDLGSWEAWVTFSATTVFEQTDSAAPYLGSRFYRAVVPTEAEALTGDHVPTEMGDAVVHPINHASFVIRWNGMMIYNDPVGGASRYTGLPRADLILVGHTHGDHMDSVTLAAVRGTNTTIVAPLAVFQMLSSSLRTNTVVLTNGARVEVRGMSVEAVPAYNITAGRNNHPRGVGNGYVLTLGGRRFYMSGDTEDIVEMRALQDIDVAFVCMNLPFTMSVHQAVDAVRVFRPRVVFPYHFSGSDANQFKRLVGQAEGVEVRVRRWY